MKRIMAVSLAAVCLSATAAFASPLDEAEGSSTTRRMTVGPEYAKGGLHRFWFGDGYRAVWTAPVELPVLDLAREAGGLTPVRQVGGFQTPGLALTGADGRSYTFRSLDKDPSRVLPPEWRTTATAKLFKDQIAASHPAAEVVYSALARSLGILYPKVRLVVMPDDPALGQFRATFANKAGTFFEYPTPGFQAVTEVISSQELFAKWLEGPENRVDSRAYLKARLLDLTVGNWDRHRNQWRWARLPDRPFWQPVPEDPDQAFSKYQGTAIAYGRTIEPKLMSYEAKYPKRIEGLVYNGADMNRWLLGGVERSLYEEVAKELQAQLTNEVIQQAVAAMPPEWRAVNGEELAGEIAGRRDGILEYARRFYERLAGSVDVRGTDRDEVATARKGDDGSLELTLVQAGAGEPHYRRRFDPKETEEVHLYLYGGNDRVETAGDSSISLRVVGGSGQDTVTGGDARLEEPWTNPAPLADGVWVEPRSDGHWTAPIFLAWWEPDIDFLFGAGFTRTSWGFRKYPWETMHSATLSYSTGEKKFKGQYAGQYRLTNERLLLRTDLLGSGIEHVNFFGFGNETPDAEKDVSRTQQDTFSFFPSLRFGSSHTFEGFLGPELKWVSAPTDTDTILNQQQPYGAGDFGEVLVRGGFEFDSRGRQGPLTGLVATQAASQAKPRRTSGVRLKAEGSYVPEAWDVTSAFGNVEGSLAGYLGNNRAILALRVGGEKVWGEYPWFESAQLGGSSDLRGFDSKRFAGDASIYVNTELRFWLGTRRTPILPLRWGVFGFYDTGRVYFEDEESDDWHYGWGGGLLMQMIGMPVTFNAALATAEEGGLKFYFKYGYAF
ncbi:MAG TPA: hypothetical protein VFM88_07730 [Vicinamibacteria bacterium]|nr:hypothetical protein [Vicinamibacteria bacterium]